MARRRPRPARLLLAAALAAPLAAEAALRAADRLACRAAAPPGPGFDLYAVGESTAKGEPYDRHGFSLAALVAARLPGPVVRHELARGGQSIFPQSVALERALRCRDPRRPGAALIYSGHNDEGRRRGASLLMRWERFLPRSRLVEAVVYRIEEKVPALRARTLDTWSFHLRRVVAACRAAGVTPVLAVPVSDERVDPGLSEPGTDAAELAPLAEAPCGALEGLAASAGPYRRPYLLWRRARCAEAAGDAASAAAFYREARDTADNRSFGRATTAQVAALRALAAEEGVALADAQAAFAARRGLFADAQHPNMDGYLLLADAYARALGATAPGPKDAAAAFAAFACGADCRAEALADAGWFWLTVSVGHAAPAPRLAAARGRFTEALALAPGLYAARLGRALAERPDLLARPEEVARLGRLGLFFRRGEEPDESARAELAAVLGRAP
ncbi:MAG: GDSL-type esterase/lipase family protein [Elusimicrobiota bacterium]|nr:GDSL-type esterase/lipase family protein [Elusimicrobiota bacterium]